MKLQVIIGKQNNPYLNLAVENDILENGSDDVMTLFLWKNGHTVVIGANQNPYTECDVKALYADGGCVSRRRTGGGAVYHDLGNLNFSFIADKKIYNVRRQMSVIQKALHDFSLSAKVTGRNDIALDGRKFSGNAFRLTDKRGLHHGTLLIKTDYQLIAKYLKINPAKLQKHGVKSVGSRVINLSEVADITSDNIIPHLIEAFENIYEGTAEFVDFDSLCTEKIREEAKYIASDEYLFAKWRDFKAKRTAVFSWGIVEMDISIDEEHGIIKDVEIASDGLDTGAIAEAKKLLIGARTDAKPQISDEKFKNEIEDIFSLIF